MSSNLIILLGQRVRSGTNFVGTTLAQHPDLVTLPRDVSLGEFNLFPDHALVSNVYNRVTRASFGMQFNESDRAGFLEAYGKAWLKILSDKYAIQPGETIFVKSPSVAHIELWKAAFPDSKIAVIYRDGRDNVISSVKASNDKRSWHTAKIRLKKAINFYSGRSFVSHARQWSETARSVIGIAESDRVKRFRYEDLVGSSENIGQLLRFYELRSSDEIIQQCLNAPVVGSSFGVDTGGVVKPNWQPDFDKSKYRFSKKWIKWNFIKKTAFKKIAGKELVALGFEKNSDW